MSDVCAACGIPWVDGRGFVEPHKPMCANARYGWYFTVSADRFGATALKLPTVQEAPVSAG